MPREDSEYWRHLAAEARATAEKMINSQARNTMLEVAKSYDRLADLVAQREPPGGM